MPVELQGLGFRLVPEPIPQSVRVRVFLLDQNVNTVMPFHNSVPQTARTHEHFGVLRKTWTAELATFRAISTRMLPKTRLFPNSI